MKKQLLFISIALMAIVTSCDKSGEEVQKISLQSLNISDAKSIFLKIDTNVNYDSGYSYWKIDKSGKESKLVLSDANNTAHADIEIKSLVKLSDEILLFKIEGTTWRKGLFFANTSTGKLFEVLSVNSDAMLSALGSISNSAYVDVKEDGEGMLYMIDGEQIIKLNTRSFQLSFELPDNQYVTNFNLTSGGFILFGSLSNREVKVRCPGSKIVPLGGFSFMCNDRIYSIEGGNIYQWKTVGTNNLDRVFICEFDISNSIYRIVENHVKNTVILYAGFDDVFEFDGINSPILIEDFPEAFRNFGENDSQYSNRARTNSALYIYEAGKLNRLDLATYKMSLIPTTEFEIQFITSDERQPGFSFTGMRYVDGKNIIGKLSSGVIETELSLDNGVKAVNLIEIF